MSKEILMVADAVSNEKGVEKEIIFEAIEAALASATRRKHGDDIDVRVAIDRESGDYDTFRRWLVFEDESTELEFPDRELRMIDAVEIDPDAEPGGYVEVPMESVEFGRIAAQTAKQVIVQKVREAEREQVVEEYQEREGELPEPALHAEPRRPERSAGPGGKEPGRRRRGIRSVHDSVRRPGAASSYPACARRHGGRIESSVAGPAPRRSRPGTRPLRPPR